MSFEQGDIVAGQYRLEDLLGRGGMGAVYRATHVGLAESVAVKLVELPPGHAIDDDPVFRQRFEREARVAFQLRHDNAVQVLDFGEVEEVPYLVMEYLEGEPLAAQLESGPLRPLERAAAIARQIADVLATMHDQSLVHRDLKPANVVLTPADGGEDAERPVLVDFGLAYLADSETLGRVTQAGETVGTPEYLAPEQGRGERDVGPAADVYSFGCVLFEMLTGDVPFPEGSPTELIGKHMFVPAPGLLESVADERTEALEPFADIVDAALEKEPGDRPDASELRDELDAWLTGDREWPRGRPPRFLQEREERAVEPSSPSPEPDADDEADEGGVVGVVGPVEDDWRLSLGTAGFECRRLESDAEASEIDVVLLPDATPERVEDWADAGAILAGTDPDDFEGATELLETAAADVVLQPVDASDLVDKVRRVWRKLQRREESS